MNEFPTLPEHYVKRIVSDMLPDDIYYLESEKLAVDHLTLRPYINKYTPVSPYDKRPQRLVGRFGLMRVFNDTLENPIDGYVIDVRFIDRHQIEQDEITPTPDDDGDTMWELEEDTKDLIAPLGILANDEEFSKDILLGHESIRPYLLYLCTHSDEIHEAIASRPSGNTNRSRSVANKKTANHTTPSNNK